MGGQIITDKGQGLDCCYSALLYLRTYDTILTQLGSIRKDQLSENDATQHLMGLGQGKLNLHLLVTIELPLMWCDFNLAESGGNTHSVGHHSILQSVQSKMIPHSNNQVRILHMKNSLFSKVHPWVRIDIQAGNNETC